MWTNAVTMARFSVKFLYLIEILILSSCEASKLNVPRVLLPLFTHLSTNFTLEVTEGGCYKWVTSRPDVVTLSPLDVDKRLGCSSSAIVRSASAQDGGTALTGRATAIVLAEEVHSGLILRCDVIVDIIHSLSIVTTTRELFVEEAPEAFEVRAYDDQGNEFSTLENVAFEWSIGGQKREKVTGSTEETTGGSVLRFISFHDSPYEAPHGVELLESRGLRANTVLLEGVKTGSAKTQAIIHLRVNLPSLPSLWLAGGILEDSFEVEVFEDLSLTLPPPPPIGADRRFGKPILMAPGSSLRLRTNRDSNDNNNVLYKLANPAKDAAILKLGPGGFVSATDKVKPIHYMMLTLKGSGLSGRQSDEEVGAEEGLLPQGLPLGLRISYHDDVGAIFSAAKRNIHFRANRLDLTRITHGDVEANDTLLVDLVQSGETMLKVVGEGESTMEKGGENQVVVLPPVVDYIKLHVGEVIIPAKPVLTVGDIICFQAATSLQPSSTSRRSGGSAPWKVLPLSGGAGRSVMEGDILRLDEQTGVGRAVSPGQALVKLQLASSGGTTSTEVDVRPIESVSVRLPRQQGSAVVGGLPTAVTSAPSVPPVEVTLVVVANLMIDPPDIYVIPGCTIQYRVLQIVFLSSGGPGNLTNSKPEHPYRAPLVILGPEDSALAKRSNVIPPPMEVWDKTVSGDNSCLIHDGTLQNYPFRCILQFSESSHVPIGLHVENIFTVRPGFDPKKGVYVCEITPVPGAASTVEISMLHVEFVLLAVATSLYQAPGALIQADLGSGGGSSLLSHPSLPSSQPLVLPFYPAIVVHPQSIQLSYRKPSAALSITGSSHVLSNVEVQVCDDSALWVQAPTFVTQTSVAANAVPTYTFTIHLKKEFWSSDELSRPLISFSLQVPVKVRLSGVEGVDGLPPAPCVVSHVNAVGYSLLDFVYSYHNSVILVISTVVIVLVSLYVYKVHVEPVIQNQHQVTMTYSPIRSPLAGSPHFPSHSPLLRVSPTSASSSFSNRHSPTLSEGSDPVYGTINNSVYQSPLHHRNRKFL
ncbi:hypothetical protein J437_LFUL014462 [Ladona fulva]|uniref:Nucleoporin 210 n=1 Tax=Ladona fulva TaxID=123851 RepID=A0A8K0KII1_LADFU|nr:hypothetical protein J437_LFUL014462 [Ladona fulva]